MRWIQCFMSAGLLAALTLTAVGADRPGEPGQKSRLSLQLQKGRTYLFEVTLPREASTLPDSSSTSAPPGSSPDGSPKTGASTESRDNFEKREAQRRADQVTSRSGDQDSLDYTIDVLETSADESTLNVSVGRSSPSNVSPTVPNGSSAAGAPRSPEGAASPAPAFNVELGSYTVKVDSLGQIRSCKASNPARPVKSAESAPRPSVPGEEPTKPSFVDPFHIQLQMILGTGLHGRDLVVGKYYYPPHSASAADGVLPGSREPAPADTKSEDRSATDTPRPRSSPDPSSTGSSPAQRPLIALRFEGTSHLGDLELARFSVIAPSTGTTSPSSTRTGSPSESAPAGESREGKGTGNATRLDQQEERLGEVTFRTNDGLIERGSAICPLSVQKSSDRSDSASNHSSIIIRRVTGITPIPGSVRK